MTDVLNKPLSRRSAIRLGAFAAGSLVVACRHMTNPDVYAVKDQQDGAVASPFGYIEINANNKIRFISTRSEAGQGISAGFAVLIAEELDVKPEGIEIVYAGVNNLIKTLSDAESGGTGGSSSIRGFYQPVRKAAASARDMLIGAAAAKWQVPGNECAVSDGQVVHAASQRSEPFANFVTSATTMPVPQNPQLKSAENFKYIGKSNRRPDLVAKVNGTAIYGIDVKVNGMLHATIVHCPFVSGDVLSVNDADALAHPGVKKVIKIPYGIAVVAETSWHAQNGAKKLQIQWTQGSTASSEAITSAQKQLVQAPALVATNTGNFDSTFNAAVKKVEAEYQSQYLPHTTLEPQNCTAWVKEDGTCEIWAPTQDPVSAAALAADILGVPEAKIKINVTLLGGGFGRRLRQDYVGEAVHIAKAMPNQPIKLLWQRKEEFTHDLYRPASYCKMQAGIDANGSLVAWMNRTACSSIFSWLEEQPSNLIKPKIQQAVDRTAVEGSSRLSYGIPNFRCEWAQHEAGVPVFWWRSVGNSQNAFFVESFMDECAVAANADPIAFRLSLLQDARQKAVLEMLRDKSGWSTPPPAGTGRGVAIHTCFGTTVAYVVEVTVKTRTIYVHKVTAVVDCGTAVDAALVHTQMESAIAQALAATTKQEITLTNGRVNQTTLNDCQPTTLTEMPTVETFIIPSTAAPGGIGEPGVPPLAPAVANAVFALTGKRLRSLPLKIPA